MKQQYIKKQSSGWQLYALSLYFILTPFYVFGSGMPQPADWIMAVLFIVSMIAGVRLHNKFEIDLISRHLMFVTYVFLINAFWFFFIDQSQEKRYPTYVNSFFYVFNFFALRTIIVYYKLYRNRLLEFVAFGVGLSMITQVLFSFAMGSTESRNSLFFNNPNQLGYFALLSGSLYIYISRKVRQPVPFQLASYVSFFYLTLLSSSKAALVGSALLIILATLSQGLFSIKKFVALTVAIGIGSYFVLESPLGSKLFDYSINRFSLIGQSKDDSYEGRGYDRILNNPEYLAIGAGEGGYYRFDTVLKAGEIHSSFGTIIFCYGFIGLFLFLRFLTGVFKGASWLDLLYFVPIFVYSITHQGLRDTLFWVFLGTVFIFNSDQLKEKYKRRVARIRNKFDGKVTAT